MTACGACQGTGQLHPLCNACLGTGLDRKRPSLGCTSCGGGDILVGTGRGPAIECYACKGTGKGPA